MTSNSKINEVGLHSIRPKILFQLVEKKFQNQNVSFVVNIPSSEIGGLTLLEHSILVSLIKLLSPKEIFEFGTYMGASSFVMAANSDDKTQITTLDIPAQELSINSSYDEKLSDIKNDNFLRESFVNKGAIYINQADEKTKSKINQIYHNSHNLDLDKNNLLNRFDFIFIDGGHDYKTIKNDTEKALKMAKKDAIIIWHDFKSNLHTNVTDFIKEFSCNHSVIHVEPSMIAFTLLGKYQDLIA